MPMRCRAIRREYGLESTTSALMVVMRALGAVAGRADVAGTDGAVAGGTTVLKSGLRLAVV